MTASIEETNKQLINIKKYNKKTIKVHQKVN